MSEFFADILNSSGVRLGDGPLDALTQLNDQKSLDGIGSASFSLPAADPRTAFITAGSKFDLYDRVDGYLGRFLYRSKTLSEQAGAASLQVNCYDQLRELSRTSVNFRRTYTNTDVATVVANLIALAAGWSATVDAGIGNTTIAYEGESILIAVDALRDRWNMHYRLGAASEFQFGAFGASSGVTLTNLRGQVQIEIKKNPNVALVESIRLVEESDEIFNRVVPLGAGQGVSTLTIEQATLGAYATQVGVNQDLSNFYYIEDAVSVAAYGVRTKVLTFPQIRPITNSDANIENAANALKLSAEAYIARHLIPKLSYAVTVRALRQTVNVGDTVRLAYRGKVDNYAYIDVDADFYVMDVSRQRGSAGERTATLTIATIAERRTADTDIMLEVISDLRALKVNIPITLAYSPVGPYVLRIDSTHAAEFTVRIGAEVTALNYAKLRFRTSPLKSSVTTVSTASSSVATSTSGGGQTPTSSSGGSQTPTSSSGGSQTPTSSSGGSQTPTSSSGGGGTVTSAGESSHTHGLTIYADDGTGSAVMYNQTQHKLHGGDLTDDVATTLGGASHTHGVTYSAHDHTVSIAAHDHTVTISAHTHTVTVSDHTHTVTVAAHTHDVTVPSHNHTPSYGLYADTVYPQVISLAIDGIDETVPLGGTWAPGNATVEVEADITTYLVNAAGGLRQNHRLSFSCGAGQGEIEAEVDMLTSIQPIAV